MNTKRNVGILVFLGGLLVVMAAHATLSMSDSVIRKGTTIEVLEPGPDLQDLIDGITDEGPAKPYLIKLGPGVYTITADGTTGFGLVMAPFISIMGSGQGVTILTGAISTGLPDSSSAIVTGASNASLTDLSVRNNGASSFSIAILNSNKASPRIQNVTATASGAAKSNVGVQNLLSSPTMNDVTATASGGTVFNIGVNNLSSSPTMSNVTATASGATSGNVGMQQISSAGTQVDSSTLSGIGTGAAGVVGIFAGDRITNTRIVGGVINDDVATNCRNTYDAALADVKC